MLLKLLKQGLINRTNLLLDNYKKLGLTENQVVIILLIQSLQSNCESVISASQISEYTNLSTKDVENEIDDLIKKKLIKVNSKKMDLTILYTKLVELIEANSSISDDEFVLGLNSFFKTKLEPNQITYLNQEVLNNYSKEQILMLVIQNNLTNFDQLKEALNKKPKSITKVNWLDKD